MRCYILFYRARARRKHYAYCLKRLLAREKYVIVQEFDIKVYNKHLLFVNILKTYYILSYPEKMKLYSCGYILVYYKKYRYLTFT